MAASKEPEEMVLVTSSERASRALAESMAKNLENPKTEVDPDKVFYVTADGRKVKPDGSEFKG